MSIINATPSDHTLRRMSSILHTLRIVAHTLDDVEDNDDLDFRWELLCLAEDLIDTAAYVTKRSRSIAWLHTDPPDDDDD
jgi:hypothetical protein